MNIQSIFITDEGFKALEKMSRDIIYAGKQFNDEEWLSILFLSAKDAGKATWNNKVLAAKSIKCFAKNTFDRYHSEGWQQALKHDGEKAMEVLSTIPKRIKTAIYLFLSLPIDRQVEQAAILLVTILVFYMAAGGSDLEGGIPDLDSKVAGIGGHRNLISHTIFCGFGTEFTIRFSTELIDKGYSRMPPDHHPAWDKIHSFIMENQHLAIGAMWAGIGAHLIKDANWLNNSTKPYVGLPGKHSMATHQTIFAANGLASEVVAAVEITS